MSLYMVSNGSLDHQASGLAPLTQRLLSELLVTSPKPSGCLVKPAPGLVFAATSIAFAIALAFLYRFTQGTSHLAPCQPHAWTDRRQPRD